MWIRKAIWHGNSTAVVIPPDLLRKFGITFSTDLLIDEENGRIVMTPLKDARIISVFKESIATTQSPERRQECIKESK